MDIMENKKVVALIAVGALAVISLIYGLASGSGARRAAPQDKSAVSKGGSPEAKASGEARDAENRRARRTDFKAWRRSPFVPKVTSGESYAGMKLSGIITAGGEYKAMMGDMIVGKGDKIEGSTVVEVRQDKVVLNNGTKDFEIKMEQ